MINLSTGRHELGGVDGGSAAHGEQHVDVVLLAHLGTAAHAVDAGIGFDARQFEQFHAGFLDLGHHGVVQTRALDRAATVGEQNSFTKLCQLLAEVLQLILSKINLDRYVINEIVHLFIYVRG